MSFQSRSIADQSLRILTSREESVHCNLSALEELFPSLSKPVQLSQEEEEDKKKQKKKL